MKKIILILLVFAFMGFYSCTKDETAPVVMLKGESTINHVLNNKFDEPGFAAFDNEDGDITDKVIVSNLDVDNAEEQDITYSVTDTEGNKGEKVRKVIVYNEADIIKGSWNAEYIYPYPSVDKQNYTDEITTSKKTNLEITFSDFGGNTGANIIGKLGTNTISFEDQSINGDAFSVQQSHITDNNTRITIEYTLGSDKGVIVFVKNN